MSVACGSLCGSRGSSNTSVRSEQEPHTTCPHCRQWCLRLNVPNTEAQTWQLTARWSGIHTGAHTAYSEDDERRLELLRLRECWAEGVAKEEEKEYGDDWLAEKTGGDTPPPLLAEDGAVVAVVVGVVGVWRTGAEEVAASVLGETGTVATLSNSAPKVVSLSLSLWCLARSN